MKKPVGIGVSAIFVLLGSLLMLGFFVLIGLVLLLSPGRAPIAPEARLALFAGLGLFGTLGAWGTTTAIGLFRLRNRARVSILIFSGFLALSGVTAAPVMLLMPSPPSAPPNFEMNRQKGKSVTSCIGARASTGSGCISLADNASQSIVLMR